MNLSLEGDAKIPPDAAEMDLIHDLNAVEPPKEGDGPAQKPKLAKHHEKEKQVHLCGAVCALCSFLSATAAHQPESFLHAYRSHVFFPYSGPKLGFSKPKIPTGTKSHFLTKPENRVP